MLRWYSRRYHLLIMGSPGDDSTLSGKERNEELMVSYLVYLQCHPRAGDRALTISVRLANGPGALVMSWAPAITTQRPPCLWAVLVTFSPAWMELSDSTPDSQQFHLAAQQSSVSVGNLSMWCGLKQLDFVSSKRAETTSCHSKHFQCLKPRRC